MQGLLLFYYQTFAFTIGVMSDFTPQPLRIFTHGVRMDGRVAGKVCLACISQIVRCRKLIFGRDIGWGL